MKIWRRILLLARRRRFEEDLAEELRIHREMAEDAARRSGSSPEDARHEAGRAFGGEALALEDSRAVWRFTWLDSVVQDIRYALRSFRKSPGFVLTVVGTLALGLGVLASAFSVFNALVLRPYAVRDPYSLYQFLGWGERKGSYQTRPFNWRSFNDFKQQNRTFSEVLGFEDRAYRVGEKNVSLQTVTGNYFDMLGGRICMGRPLTPADDAPGAAIAVASYAAWKDILGSDPNAIGRKVQLESIGSYTPVEVVGVACPEFNGVRESRVDFWASLAIDSAFFGAYGSDRLTIIGRLRPGVTPEAAEAELVAYGRRIYTTWRYAQKRPGGATLKQCATIYPLNAQSIANFLPVFAAFGLVLVIACANVSNMMLARAVARQREIAIRISLGAGRIRMLRQMLTEGLLLALPAAFAAYWVACGTIRLAFWLQVKVLHADQRARLSLWNSMPDWRVFAFLLGTACVTTVVFALGPALQTLRARLIEGRRGDSADRRPARLRSLLVVAQVAVCALLLIAAGVALRGERQLVSRDIGFDANKVFMLHTPVVPFRNGLKMEGRHIPMLFARVKTHPLIAGVALCQYVPHWRTFGDLPKVSSGSREVAMPFNVVSRGYLGIFGIGIRGRDFSEEESNSGAPVAIVSETLAHRLWPGSDPLGKTIYLGETWKKFGVDSRAALVIGVAEDSNFQYDASRFPEHEGVMAYLPKKVDANWYGQIVARVNGDPAAARRVLASIVTEVAPGALVEHSLRSLRVEADLYLYPYRALLAISSALGVLALLLTVSGVFGVSSYVVAQRRKEIGIRIALGAASSRIAAMVLQQSLKLAVVGAVLGSAAAFAVAHIMAHSIRRIDVFDAAGYAAGIAVVIAAAIAAAYVPARRAVKVDPVVTLRCD